MPLLRLSQLQLNIGEQIVFDQLDLTLRAGERLCLLGRNGCGKSTLLKVVDGSTQADSGEVWRKPGLKVARMHQNLDFAADDASVFDVVADGLEALGSTLRRYHELIQSELDDLRELESLQREIESLDGWRYQQRIESILSRLELNPEARIGGLSGGWLRRVALARALVSEPDILLLDEPTNHLDLEGILWLEQCVRDFPGCVLFVTHDRALIESLADQILELDRGKLERYDCNYQTYLERRAHKWEVEEEQNALFDKRLAQEETWIRQGIKARRTRNEGRVRALKAMRDERSQRRERQGTANLSVNQGERSGKMVAELQNVSYGIGGKNLVNNFSLLLQRGDKLALIGPNGAGKTTLLRLILGELQPDSGTIKSGTNLNIAYFDQLRDRLDEDQRVVDIVGQGSDMVTINGKDRHIMSYLSDFLFTPQRARSHFRVLSGGERARVQLACLFSQPANVLVLDEPTNDLDMETLELLESLLVDFEGTVLLVSHDRAFVDNVASNCLLFEGNGVISEHVGGFSEVAAYQARLAKRKAAGGVADKKPEPTTVASTSEQAPAAKASAPKRKLSYKDQRELDSLPDKIDELESEIARISELSADPAFYQQDGDKVTEVLQQLATLQGQLDEAMERWMDLSE
ncbi:ATP-binding cassette domain-containing protein [Spongiibacter sp. KMU-158]|uniref:ATP-binding protein Uup n=1 Tax=Spongiibacter pelagi TaxID=2760804 RepID=A0A927BZL9_9GAMM|nr:ATP-binding cassette domain-containing protein [Spongiibacter pelagi]MBD2858523.1 ATP-binding cassette domain-containing protein [Spongiibacter pelagi]